MQEYLLKMLVEIILKRLSKDMLRGFVDSALDFVEDAVENSETQADDIVILPLCKLVRASFNVEE